MKLLLSLFTAFTVIAVSSNAFALIEGQLLVGQRSATIDAEPSYDLSGTETKLSVYLDPIPLVPVGFGLSFANVDLGDKPDSGITGFKGSEISLDVTAWLPLGIAGFKPYAKIGYVIAGEYTVSTVLGDSSSDASGTKFSAGLKYSPLPLIAVMLEFEKSAITLKPDTGSDSESDNTSIFLGVAAGI